MKKIIFSKYSNDRNKNFKIHTDILEDETGKRYVRKVGMTEEGRAHLKVMSENAVGLETIYEKTIFDVNKCCYSDGVLELEYIEGRTIESMLDFCIAENKYDKLSTLLTMYVCEMRKLATERFQPCEKYYEIFGEEAYSPAEATSMKLSNVDMIFANIIENEDRWTVLDYEWTFPVLVPIEFILYRTINYYLTPKRIKGMGDVDIYRLFGIDRDLCDKFQIMEENFQKFVYKDNTPLWALYGTIGKEYFFPAGMVEARHIQNERVKIMAVRFYEGSFESFEIDKKPDEHGDVVMDIDTRGCNTLRIDPAFASCIIYIKKLTAVKNDAEEDIAYGTNGTSSDNNLMIFNTDTPQILIGNIGVDIKKLHIEYNIEFVNKTMLGYLETKNASYNDFRCENVRQLEIIKDYCAELEDMKCKNNESLMQIEELSKRIEAMECSLSWKLTKPARSISGRIRR